MGWNWNLTLKRLSGIPGPLVEVNSSAPVMVNRIMARMSWLLASRKGHGSWQVSSLENISSFFIGMAI